MRARAASYKLPQTIRIVTADQLPLTATGKVNKKVLKEQTQASLEHPRSS
jgi:acyl-CoA synthetase (AMP-forming)/AMP-acid ligase II